jgi:hypothetical protein
VLERRAALQRGRSSPQAGGQRQVLPGREQSRGEPHRGGAIQRRAVGRELDLVDVHRRAATPEVDEVHACAAEAQPLDR